MVGVGLNLDRVIIESVEEIKKTPPLLSLLTVL